MRRSNILKMQKNLNVEHFLRAVTSSIQAEILKGKTLDETRA